MATDQDIAKQILSDSTRTSTQPDLPEPSGAVQQFCPEAQNALRAAVQSSADAIFTGRVINRLLKQKDGKALNGQWSAPAQDNLRAAVLFAGAGLDRALKRLVEETLPLLISTEEAVEAKFQQFAAQSITDASTSAVSPKELVRLLLGSGDTPRDVVTRRWISELTGGSAQSVDRVEAVSIALGVTKKHLRNRVKPNSAGSAALKASFVARNEIAHELDVTKPREEVRKALEGIRRKRTVASVEQHVFAMLSVTQEIINDVADRLAGSASAASSS